MQQGNVNKEVMLTQCIPSVCKLDDLLCHFSTMYEGLEAKVKRASHCAIHERRFKKLSLEASKGREQFLIQSRQIL